MYFGIYFDAVCEAATSRSVSTSFHWIEKAKAYNVPYKLNVVFAMVCFIKRLGDNFQ